MALHPVQERAIALVEAYDLVSGESTACSGTLIASNQVLTAAHCIPSTFDGSNVVVSFSESGQDYVRLGANEVLEMPALDVGVLVLEADLNDIDVEPVQVATEATVNAGDLVQIAGLGLTERGEWGTRQFAVARVSEISDAEFVVQADHRAAACSGDSGGPALVRNSDGLATIVGVLSRGTKGCSDADTFVRVEHVYDWLVATGLTRPVRQAVSADCDMIGPEGRCFGSVVISCDEGAVRADRCGAPLHCGFSREAAGYRCVLMEDDACPGVNDRGSCVGTSRVRCAAGIVLTEPCDACGATCQLSARSGSAICNSTAGD